MEVDDRQSEGEPEPDEEMLQDVVDYEEEVTPATLDERRPLLLPGRAVDTDPDLTQARAAMQPFYCPEMKQGKCIDTKMLTWLITSFVLCTRHGLLHRHGLQCRTFRCKKSFRKGVVTTSWETGLVSCATSILKPRSAGTSLKRKF